MKKACRHCKYYDLPRVQNARGHIMSNRFARCEYSISLRATLPDSIKKYNAQNLDVFKSYMGPAEGTNCATFERREEDSGSSGNRQ